MMVLITGRACTAIAFVFRKACSRACRSSFALGCPSLPIITSTGSQHHGTSKPNEMHARMNMPTGAATRRDIYQRMLEKIRPYFTKERFARALLGIFCALMASPLSSQARGLRVAIFDFELIDTSLEGATNGPRADEAPRLVRLGARFRA